MRSLISYSACDALKVCVMGNDLFNLLQTEDVFNFDGGCVKVNERIYNLSGETKEILCRVLLDGLDYLFAELQLSHDKYSWITICDRSFYDVLTNVEGDKISMVATLEALLPALGLSVLHVTSADICLDVNVSATARIKKAIRDTQGLAMIVNGRRVPDDAPSIGYFYQANRFRLLGQPTIYLKNTGGLALKIYDKGRELEQVASYKNNYIRQWSGITGETMHRVELSIRGNRIDKFCQANRITQEEFLEGLLHHDFRMKVLEELLDDVLRFNPVSMANRKQADKVSVIDVVLGRYE